MDSAATQAKAGSLAANRAQTDLQQAIDPQQDGKYTGSVNGQAAANPVIANGAAVKLANNVSTLKKP